jgi:ABC-2 type transport system ATP-binding protein
MMDISALPAAPLRQVPRPFMVNDLRETLTTGPVTIDMPQRNGLPAAHRRSYGWGMKSIIEIRNLEKTYDGGFQALKGVDLDIREGEILALLGPNGAGKTTLISTVCGIATPTGGRITVGGHDVITDYRAARRLIGLVPQEINLEPFERVRNSVRFSRGLFGHPPDEAHLEHVLRALSLWDKRDAKIVELSGGMKRRVLIAKALAHEPRVLFLDEPTAGVDVELRRDMWETVRRLKADGVTIILTTHYIEEAEAIADRIGIIAKGEILLVEQTAHLMERMGRKEMRVDLQEPVTAVPERLGSYELRIEDEGRALVYSYDTAGERTGIARLFADLTASGLVLRDVQTRQSSLEEIFVGLVRDGEQAQ